MGSFFFVPNDSCYEGIRYYAFASIGGTRDFSILALLTAFKSSLFKVFLLTIDDFLSASDLFLVNRLIYTSTFRPSAVFFFLILRSPFAAYSKVVLSRAIVSILGSTLLGPIYVLLIGICKN